MFTTNEIVDNLRAGQCREIADSIANLLESRPDYRQDNDGDVIALSIAAGIPYATVRGAFDAVRMHERSQPPTGMVFLAAAKLGMTCVPINLGGTLASALRESNPECRYFMRAKNLSAFNLIGRNPIGESNGRTRVSSAHYVIPCDHSEGIQWHPMATLNRPKYRGLEQPDVDVHLSTCGQYKIENISGVIKVHEQDYNWSFYDFDFESVTEAKQFASCQSSAK